MARCNLDLEDRKFVILGDASSSELQSGLTELRDKLSQDHKLSGWFNQPMPKFPQFQNKVWKWDFAPTGEKSSTRKGWRLFAYVPDPNGPEPILARAFLCYDKDEQPNGNPAKFLARKLKNFLEAVIEIQAVPERFRRQTTSDDKIVSMCYECFETIFSDDEGEAEIAESIHECPATKTE